MNWQVPMTSQQLKPQKIKKIEKIGKHQKNKKISFKKTNNTKNTRTKNKNKKWILSATGGPDLQPAGQICHRRARFAAGRLDLQPAGQILFIRILFLFIFIFFLVFLILWFSAPLIFRFFGVIFSIISLFIFGFVLPCTVLGFWLVIGIIQVMN